MSTLSDQLRSEAERQAREGLAPHPFITHCSDCRKPFQFGVFAEQGDNVYSVEGARETQITGTCETCFDGYFDGDDE